MSNDEISTTNAEKEISTDFWTGIIGLVVVSCIFSSHKCPKYLTKKQIALMKYKKKRVAKKWLNKAKQLITKYYKHIEKHNKKHYKNYAEIKNLVKNGNFEELKTYLEKYNENKKTDC